MDDDDINAEIQTIEDGMADDFAGYQGDTAKQERYGQLLQAREDGTDAPARPDADTVRRGELETLMKDQTGAYWKGSQRDRLQAEYLALAGDDQRDGRPSLTDQPGTGDGTGDVTDADADAGLAALATGGDVARQWGADLGTGAGARTTLRVGEDQRQKLMAAFGDSAGDVETAFSGLEENVQMAVYREMANTYSERQPPASKEDMEKFVGTEHGRMLVAEWGFEAPRRVSAALYRWSRMTIFLTEQESDSLHDHFWRMTAKERAAIVAHLGGE